MKITIFILAGILGLAFYLKDRGFIVKGRSSEQYPEPIALVRVEDTIYHCSNVTKGWCGISAACGQYTLTCIKKNYEVQYLIN